MLNELILLKNNDYKQFSEKIINTKYEILGVKMEYLKKIAKNNINDYKSYFSHKHQYYEEYMIHGLMLGYLKLPFDELNNYIDQYINSIDCWSMVDSIASNLKIYKNHREETFIKAKEYINSNQEFKKRFGYCILLSYYINTNDKPYLNDILNLCNKEHHEYYVQMMVAWLLSVAYVYFKDEVLKLLINNQLDNFTYNKTLSKICDSYRITKEEKQIIKSMRR